MLKYAIDDLNAGVTAASSRLRGGPPRLAAVGAVFRFLMRRILIGASRDIEYDLRNAFFAPAADAARRTPGTRTGDLMSRATNDLNAVRMMIGPAVMYPASTILTFSSPSC